VTKELSNGKVVGVDLEEIDPIDDVTTIRADITVPETLDLIRDALGKADVDVVICDAAPNLSGNWTLDHARSIDLSRSALAVAGEVHRPGGRFLVKVYHGESFKEYLSEVKSRFRTVRAHSPATSRKASAEMYVVGQGFLKAPPVAVGEEIELEIVGTGKSGDGVAKVEGFKIFVRGAGQGETLWVRITSVRPGHATGEPISKTILNEIDHPDV